MGVCFAGVEKCMIYCKVSEPLENRKKPMFRMMDLRWKSQALPAVSQNYERPCDSEVDIILAME